MDLITSLLILQLCYFGKKLDEKLEIIKLIKEGKKMEKEVIVDVKYEIITDQQPHV